MTQRIKYHFLQSLFQLVSALAGKSGGWTVFVKPKLLIGSLIISSSILAQQATVTKQETKQNKNISKHKVKHKAKYPRKHKRVTSFQPDVINRVSCYVTTTRNLPQPIKEIPPEVIVDLPSEETTQPAFSSGIDALYDYLSKHVIYPPLAREAGIEGKVIVGYVVGIDGRVSDVRVLRSLDPSCDEEAVKLVKNMPAWTPGKQGDKAVKVRMTLPIVFKLDQ